MNDLDRKIQAALQRDNPAHPLGREPNFAEEMIAAFRGRNRWLTALAAAFNFLTFGLAVWAGFKFYEASTTTLQLRWGGLALLFVAMTMQLKIWFWHELHTNRILREIKRVELLLASRPPH